MGGTWEGRLVRREQRKGEEERGKVTQRARKMFPVFRLLRTASDTVFFNYRARNWTSNTRYVRLIDTALWLSELKTFALVFQRVSARTFLPSHFLH